jgi:hypothetical protein
MVEQGGAPRLQPEGVEVPAPHMPQAPRNRRKGDEAVEIF